MSSIKERNFDGYTLELPRKPFESAFSDVYVYRHPDWDFEVIGDWDKDASRSFALKFLSKTSVYNSLSEGPTHRPGLIAVFMPEFPETLWWWFAPQQLEIIEQSEQ